MFCSCTLYCIRISVCISRLIHLCRCQRLTYTFTYISHIHIYNIYIYVIICIYIYVYTYPQRMTIILEDYGSLRISHALFPKKLRIHDHPQCWWFCWRIIVTFAWNPTALAGALARAHATRWSVDPAESGGVNGAKGVPTDSIYPLT